MKLLLVLCLVGAMAPGLGEVAESVVHFATAGHLAHSEAGHCDLGDQGDEHGCGATQHHCGCCASQVLASAPGVVVGVSLQAGADACPTGEPLASLHQPAPPFRPPIAA